MNDHRVGTPQGLGFEGLRAGAGTGQAIVSHRFGIADAEQAMTLAHRDPKSLKAVVVPAGASR